MSRQIQRRRSPQRHPLIESALKVGIVNLAWATILPRNCLVRKDINSSYMCTLILMLSVTGAADSSSPEFRNPYTQPPHGYVF